MSEIKTFFTRNKNVESVHSAKCLIVNSLNEIIFTTNNDQDTINEYNEFKNEKYYKWACENITADNVKAYFKSIVKEVS